jgi:hypothetical protein
VSSLELGSVTIQARLGSARLLYKLDSARLGYCTSSARARLSSTRLGSFTGLPPFSREDIIEKFRLLNAQLWFILSANSHPFIKACFFDPFVIDKEMYRMTKN